MPKRLSDLEHYDKVRDGWLLDTNIISAIVGGKALHPGVHHFFQNIRDERLRLSVLTIGELYKGINLLLYWPSTEAQDPEQITTSKGYILQRKLEELETLWADRILPIDSAVVKAWGDLAALNQQRGAPIPVIDGLIAATAYVHNLVVVSNDAVFGRMRDRVIVYDPMAFDATEA